MARVEVKLGLHKVTELEKSRDIVKPHDASPHTKNSITKAVNGDVVRFEVDADLTAEFISFAGPSPFASGTVWYQEDEIVSAAPGSYRYNCRIRKPDGTLINEGGGEMEISH